MLAYALWTHPLLPPTPDAAWLHLRLAPEYQAAPIPRALPAIGVRLELELPLIHPWRERGLGAIDLRFR